MSKRTAARLTTVLTLLLAVGAVIAGWLLRDAAAFRGYYYPVAAVILILCLIPFFLRFECRREGARELCVLAVICALAIGGRALFFLVPFFKPMAAIVILAGALLGADAGFLCGAVTMFVSNFLFGQGPWTPFQMIALGLCGLVAGLLFYGRRPRLWLLCLYGVPAVFILYGGVVNFSSLLLMNVPLTAASLLAVYGAGIPFDAVFAASTALFLLPLFPVFSRSLSRLQSKYGLFSPPTSADDRSDR